MTMTAAQIRFMQNMPDDWDIEPTFGDMRPRAPLVRLGFIERKQTDETPPEWGNSPVRLVRQEWRITPAGRAALAEEQK